MIQYAKDNTKAAITVPDVLCPECFRYLLYPTITSHRRDRYGRELRTYLGWCINCRCGCETVQFKRENRWVMHKYQQYKPTDRSPNPLPTGEWHTLVELPEPAPVVIGPGGEYDNPVTPDALDLLKLLRKALESTLKLVTELTKSAEKQ